MCIGDLFDGAANMSGVYNGSQALLTTHFTDMCIPNFFSLSNGVRRSTFDAGLVTKFGAFSSLNFPKLI
jgi:hypothetical protein